MYDTIDIILFIFVLGGCIGVLNYMGAFNAAIAALVQSHKRAKNISLIILITHYYRSRWNYIRSGRRNDCTLPDSGTGLPCRRV
ncbi:MAG: hypothetical protein ACLUUO_20810 [Sellimonas intestinalis]